MKIVIVEGGRVPCPSWYFPAYDEFRLNTNLACVICYPIGIHLIVRIVRRLWHWYRWNIDRKVGTITKYDELDYANKRIENLIFDNRLLRLEIATLRLMEKNR